MAAFSALSLTAIHLSPAAASILLLLATAAAIVFAVVSGLPGRAERLPWLLLGILCLYQFASAFWFPAEGTGAKILAKLPLVAGLLFIAPIRFGKLSKLWWLILVNLPLTWISLASVVNYFRHFRFLNQMILESKPLPVYTQVYHIEFSIILATAALSGLIYLVTGKPQSGFKKSLLWTSVLINAVCLHILAVRTGILGFWAGSLTWTGWKMLQQPSLRKPLVISLAILLSVAMLLPSIRNRALNTAEDFNAVVRHQNLTDKSFGQRWEAWKASIWVIKSHPAAGVGLKGVETALDQGYTAIHTQLPVSKRVMPHNQYLDTTLQSGVPAGILLLLFFATSFFLAWRFKNNLLIAIVPLFVSVCLFESILERQAGILAFLLFLTFAVAEDSGASGNRAKEISE